MRGLHKPYVAGALLKAASPSLSAICWPPSGDIARPWGARAFSEAAYRVESELPRWRRSRERRRFRGVEGRSDQRAPPRSEVDRRRAQQRAVRDVLSTVARGEGL